MLREQPRIRAPELIGDADQWINSEPLTLSELREKVVLLDFWAYSCINCVRTIPCLAAMWGKYKDRGVLIIGVHTPEFEFEKEFSNVKSAVERLRIKYPVLNDPRRINWENYGNRYWPRAELIVDRGVILDHIGEAGYEEIDQAIADTLTARGEKVEGACVEGVNRIYLSELSPETYAGYLRNPGLGSTKVCTISGCDEFHAPEERKRDVIYLSGLWRQEPEYLEFKGGQGMISESYFGREVNVVMGGHGAAEVFLNGRHLTRAEAGSNIFFRNGNSMVKIDHSDMCNLVSTPDFQTNELKIIPFPGLRVYAYTFG